MPEHNPHAGVVLAEQPVITHPRELPLLARNVPAPNELFLQREDRLLIRAWNSVTSLVVNVAGRYLAPDGHIHPFHERLTPTTDRALTTGSFQLGEGFLLSLMVFPTGATPRRGQSFVQVRVDRGTAATRIPVHLLVSDYVVAEEALAWPGSKIRSSTEGPGVLRTITGTDPAAGSQIAETVPTNVRWRWYSMFFTGVTVVTGIQIRADFRDDTDAIFYRTGEQNQAAGATFRYSVGAHGANYSGAGETLFYPTPPSIWLFQGYDFVTSQLAAFPGDANLSAPVYEVEEWIEE